MKTYWKDPDSTLDYSINWTLWLAGDTIASSAWILEAGLAAVATSNTASITTIWLSGGTVWHRQYVTNRIVTAGGRTEDRTFWLVIEEH